MTLQNVLQGIPRKREIDAVVELLCSGEMREGETFRHEQLERVVEVTRESNPARYYGIVRSARRRVLLEHGIWMTSLHGVGLQVPSGRDQLRSGVGEVRRGARRIRNGAAITASVSDDRLPHERDRLARNQMVTDIKYLAEVARTRTQAVQLLVGKTETPPPMKLAAETA